MLTPNLSYHPKQPINLTNTPVLTHFLKSKFNRMRTIKGMFDLSNEFDMLYFMNKKERIEFLCRSLERHNHLYYIEAQPEISDREYDALLRELEILKKTIQNGQTPPRPPNAWAEPHSIILKPFRMLARC